MKDYHLWQFIVKFEVVVGEQECSVSGFVITNDRDMRQAQSALDEISKNWGRKSFYVEQITYLGIACEVNDANKHK